MTSRQKTVNNEMKKTIGKEQAKALDKSPDTMKKQGSFTVGAAKVGIVAVALANSIKQAKYKKMMKEYDKLRTDRMMASSDRSSPSYWATVFKQQELDKKREKFMKSMNRPHMGPGMIGSLTRMAHDRSMATMLSGSGASAPGALGRSDVVSNTGHMDRSVIDILAPANNEPSAKVSDYEMEG